MNKILITGLLICLLLVTGCGLDGTNSFNSKDNIDCEKICLNEEMSLDRVTNSGEGIICRCYRNVYFTDYTK